MSRITLIEEEDHVSFTRYDQLAFRDIDDINVELFVDGELVGSIPVWGDSEMDGREYITLNYTIVYLDTLRKLSEQDVLVEQALRQIVKDVNDGDLTAIEGLLQVIPIKTLKDFLPEKL